MHGRGVFASRPIRAGETLIDWSECTHMLTPVEAAQLPDEERRYLSVIDGQHIQFSPPARFVNHSCEPNARGRDGADVALRDIAAGEEITVDYAAENVPDLDIACRCGAANCRKSVRNQN